MDGMCRGPALRQLRLGSIDAGGLDPVETVEMSWDERKKGKVTNPEENDLLRPFLSDDIFTEREGNDGGMGAAPVLERDDSRAPAPVHMAAALVEQVILETLGLWNGLFLFAMLSHVRLPCARLYQLKVLLS